MNPLPDIPEPDPLDNPLDNPLDDSLGSPLDHSLGSPLNPPSVAFGSNIPGPEPTENSNDFNPYDHTSSELEELFMDGTGNILNQLEKGIEGSMVPPEPKPTKVELFQDPGWALQTPNVESNPPQLPDQETPEIPIRPVFPQSHWGVRQFGASIGLRSGCSHDSEKIFCPLENDFIFLQFCEEQDCQYLDEDTRECKYNSEEDVDSDRHEPGKGPDIDRDGAYY